MSIEYFLNKERGFVYIKPKGEISLREMLKHQKMIAADPDFDSEGLALFDFSELVLTDVNFKLMVTITRHDPAGKGCRRAIVAPSTVAYGMARMFQTLTRSNHGKTAVFRELAAAKTWLGLEENDPVFSSTIKIQQQETAKL